MLKFRCQHCGQRIAVGARHLGKLVTCPECGEPTHPLAEQIVSLQSAAKLADRTAVVRSGPTAPVAAVMPARPPTNETPPAKKPAADKEPEENCANCGQPFGRLQQRASWQGHPVCATCHAKLAGDTLAAEQAATLTAGDLKKTFIVAPGAPVAPDSPESAGPVCNVAARRVPLPPEPALPQALASGAQIAGRLALRVGMGTWANARELPLLTSKDDDAQADLVHPVEPDTSLPAVAPSVHGRLFIALAVLCLTGAAVYGILSVLANLAGYLTAAAFVLMVVAGGYLLLKGWLAASRRFVLQRSAGRPTRASSASKNAA